MADMVIRGIDMPKTEEDSKLLILSPNGVTELNGMLGTNNPKHDVIKLGPHGRLIDLDGTALARYYDVEHEEWSMETVTVEDILWGVCENMPPIVIPADKDGET